MSSNLAIQLKHSKIDDLVTEGLILGLFEGEGLEGELSKQLDQMYEGTISKLIDRGEIRGELKEFHILHRVDLPVQKIIILGCGKREKFNQDTVRFLAAKGARTARKAGQQESSFLLEPYKALDSFNLGVVTAEGLIMGLNRFEQYKSKKKSSKDKLSKFIVLGQGFDQDSLDEGLKRGEILGRG
ncbi:MAG: M17 family peptidase N-terminal domain-containing protein, partial [bacterium]|nr:M17 family peptidase N-terminal domain-containing protein [bacterium]